MTADNGTSPATTVDTSSSRKRVSGYRTYVESQTDRAARTARDSSSPRYGPATSRRRRTCSAPVRYHYEAIEPVAESFGEPRSGDRRARVNDVAEPATAGPAFTGSRRSSGSSTQPQGTETYASSLLPNVDELVGSACGRCRSSRPARQRRRRAPERGRGLQDHGRGGSLLAHRPLRLPGQPRGRPEGVRRCFARRSRSAADHDSSQRPSPNASPPSRRRPRPVQAAERLSATRSTARSPRPTAARSRSRSTRSPSRSRPSP